MAIFNVHKNSDYRWTISKRLEILSQVPYVKLVEYRQDMSALLASFARYAYLGANAGGQIQTMYERFMGQFTGATQISPLYVNSSNSYEGLYRADLTGNLYILPWYSSYHHELNNRWEDKTGALDSVISTVGDQVSKFVSPAGGLDVPQAWQNLDAATLNFEMSLINTDFETKELIPGINKHMDLLDALILANVPIRDGFFTMLPPCIYTMLIPGVRHSPACVIAQLSIDNSGQLNRYNLGGKRNDVVIPDEWKIRFTIIELIKESNLIYQGVMDVSKQVKAVSTNSFNQDIQAVANMVGTGFNSTRTAMTQLLNTPINSSGSILTPNINSGPSKTNSLNYYQDA